MFEFELTPLEQIVPWGKAPDLRLHWFGLTDGKYRLAVGQDYLLNYAENADASSTTFVEYQVVRLWEDILDMLPAILEPVPHQLHHLFDESAEYRQRWVEKAEEIDPESLAEKCIFWLDHRSLDCGYLVNAPRILIWSTETDVTFSWDNEALTMDGLPMWSASRGSYHMSRDEFLDAVKEFDRSLISQMDERVRKVISSWNSETISIDLEGLAREQEDRSSWLANQLRRTQKTPWQEILPHLPEVK